MVVAVVMCYLAEDYILLLPLLNLKAFLSVTIGRASSYWFLRTGMFGS